MKTVFINEYGHICDESISRYKVLLNGSYRYYYLSELYRYEIHSIEPKIDLKYILSYKKL